MTDPTQMRNQQQLTTASGTVWVVIAGVTTMLVGGMFVALWQSLADQLALVGAVAVAALFVGMLVVRIFVPAGKTRLMLLAADYGTMLLVALVFVFLVLSGQ